jgi:hypothetical protein
VVAVTGGWQRKQRAEGAASESDRRNRKKATAAIRNDNKLKARRKMRWSGK